MNLVGTWYKRQYRDRKIFQELSAPCQGEADKRELFASLTSLLMIV